MTKDETTRLANLAFNQRQTVPAYTNGLYVISQDELHRFAELVAAAERDAVVRHVARAIEAARDIK